MLSFRTRRKSLYSTLIVCEKIYCMVCWGGGLSLTYRVKPGPSTSFPASIWVAIVVEIWSWNQCGITHHSTHCAASKNVPCRRSASPRGRATSPSRPTSRSHRGTEPRLCGFLGLRGPVGRRVTYWLLATTEQRGGRIFLHEEHLSGLCRVPAELRPAPCLVQEALPSFFSLFVVKGWAAGSYKAPEKSNSRNTFCIIFQSNPNFVHRRFKKFGVHV